MSLTSLFPLANVLGTLLDAPDVVTLEEPNLHSFHCLLDVRQCAVSDYEVLMDPVPGETLHQRAYALDSDSKQKVTELAKALGSSSSCTTCTGAKATHGFRVNMTATVVQLGDAVMNTDNHYYLVTPLGQQNANVDRLQQWMLDSVTRR